MDKWSRVKLIGPNRTEQQRWTDKRRGLSQETVVKPTKRAFASSEKPKPIKAE